MTVDWLGHAACLGCDTSIFFDDNKTARAKAICKGCDVRSDCLEWALAHPFHTRCGVWGGLTERSRRSIRRDRGLIVVPPIPPEPPECGTERGYKHHKNHGEKVCTPCQEAWAEHHRRRRAADRDRMRARAHAG